MLLAAAISSAAALGLPFSDVCVGFTVRPRPRGADLDLLVEGGENDHKRGDGEAPQIGAADVGEAGGGGDAGDFLRFSDRESARSRSRSTSCRGVLIPMAGRSCIMGRAAPPRMRDADAREGASLP